MQMAQPAAAVFAMNQAASSVEDEAGAKHEHASSPSPASDLSSDASASEADAPRRENSKPRDTQPKNEDEPTLSHAAADSADAEPSDADANADADAPDAQRAFSLKLRLREPEPAPAPAASSTESAPELNGSRRRSERIRTVSARSEDLRRAREERLALEKARSEARSAAAKKGVKTKRKAAQAAAAGLEPPPKRVPKQIVTLKYANPVAPPVFAPIKVDSVDVFWHRLNLREFLLRFDKLCRVPARFTAAINDPLSPWTPELFKAVILGMLKLIQNDTTPLHSGVRTYLAEIDQLEAGDPKVWDWLLEFVEQLDAYAPTAAPETEADRLDLVRRLMVICTGTETIRITVMSDMDQLKYVEKDASDEIKQIYAKLKETEQKLAKLKQVDKQVHKEKVAAAQRAADNKAWRAQQQLYQKLHKFNMRTSPMAVDELGNKYWSLQYKSKEHSAWGSWIMCEALYDPAELAAWHRQFGLNVNHVLEGRDEMVAEKIAERKRHRKEARGRQAAAAATEPGSEPGSEAGAEAADETGARAAGPASESERTEVAGAAKGAAGDGAQRSQPKRRYPKLKIDFPKPSAEPRLYYVEGRDNIAQLAEWVGGLRGVEPKMKTSISDVANFLALE